MPRLILFAQSTSSHLCESEPLTPSSTPTGIKPRGGRTGEHPMFGMRLSRGRVCKGLAQWTGSGLGEIRPVHSAKCWSSGAAVTAAHCPRGAAGGN